MGDCRKARRTSQHILGMASSGNVGRAESTDPHGYSGGDGAGVKKEQDAATSHSIGRTNYYSQTLESEPSSPIYMYLNILPLLEYNISLAYPANNFTVLYKVHIIPLTLL